MTGRKASRSHQPDCHINGCTTDCPPYVEPPVGRQTTPTCPACGFVLSSIHGDEWWCERCPWDGTERDRTAGRDTTPREGDE